MFGFSREHPREMSYQRRLQLSRRAPIVELCCLLAAVLVPVVIMTIGVAELGVRWLDVLPFALLAMPLYGGMFVYNLRRRRRLFPDAEWLSHRKTAVQRIPDGFTAYRLVAAPVVAGLVGFNHWEAALALCLGAFASDLVDGWLARRFGFIREDGFDVFCDRAIIIAPVLGLLMAGDLYGKWGMLLVFPWVVAMYTTERFAPRQVDLANATLWAVGYLLTAWQAFVHLPTPTAIGFSAGAVAFMLLGAATHRSLVRRGVSQVGLGG